MSEVLFFVSDFLFENVVAAAAGHTDFTPALRSTQALLALRTFEVGEVLTVPFNVCTELVAYEGYIPVVFFMTFGQIPGKCTEVGIDKDEQSQCAEKIALHEEVDDYQNQCQRG